MPDTKKPEFIKQTPKGFMMRIMMMVDLLRKKKAKQDVSMKHLTILITFLMALSTQVSAENENGLQPKRVSIPKQELIELCLKHLPKNIVLVEGSYLVRIKDTDKFLRYTDSGSCYLKQYK